jgi:predicted metal-dependent hydrolase
MYWRAHSKCNRLVIRVGGEQIPAQCVLLLVSETSKEFAVASTNTVDKAAAAFKKQQQAREGEKAMAEYRAAQIAEEKKTERLRALRLAREGAPDVAAPAGLAGEIADRRAPARKPIAPRRKPTQRRTTARKRH